MRGQIAPSYHPVVVLEAELEETDAGLVPASTGWFVMNARGARWFHRPGRDSLPLTGSDEFEAERRAIARVYCRTRDMLVAHGRERTKRV